MFPIRFDSSFDVRHTNLLSRMVEVWGQVPIALIQQLDLHNVMLIVLQKPAATHVAGFQTWHRLGRHVRKGERGLIAPFCSETLRAERQCGD
jgi:hypothetical protein